MENVINSILEGYTFSKKELLTGYIIIVKGKVFRTYSGKFIFSSKRQAVAAFYNALRWKTSITMRVFLHHDRDNIDRSMYWDMFKNAIKNEFKIVKINNEQ